MVLKVLLSLLLRIAPGYALGLISLLVIPRQRTEIRLIIYILMFVLFRDAMTPLRLWTLSAGGTIRFIQDPVIQIDLGLLALAAVFVTNAFEPELARLVVWVKGRAHWAALAGFAGAACVVAPTVLLKHALMPDLPPVPVPLWSMGPLLTLCLAGNLLEEVLFRGYFQGLIERTAGPVRAAFASGLFFALCHSFLATTVTSLGVPLLAFTWFEGTVAGLIRMRFGVIASTLAHGLAIFSLASGIFK